MRILLHLLLAVFLFCPCSVQAAGPYQAPPRTADGAANLTHHWIEGGGARLYWQSVDSPKQVRLRGSYFRDPASYPYLTMDEKKPVYKKKSLRKKTRRTASNRKKSRKATAAKAVQSEKKKAVSQAETKPRTDQIFLAPGATATTAGEPKKTEPVRQAPPSHAADPVGSIPAEPLQ